MSDHEEFLERPEVKRALEALVARRLQMTEAGSEDAELPDAHAFLLEEGLEVPAGANVRLKRTVHDSDVIKPLGPYCGDQQCRPVNCHWIGKQFVCEWVCA